MKKSFFQTKRADWGFIIPATLVWILALLVTAWDFVYVQGMSYHFGIVNAIGLGLGLTGAFIRRVAIRTLGNYFSSGLKTLPDHKLIKYGVYRYVRHPAYFGALLATVAIPIFFSSLYSFLLMLGLLPCYLHRIRIEEKMLIEKFGDEYREYMKMTKKLIPFIY